jgi:Exosome complex exonuclease RRP4 N-terminal region
LKKVKTIAAVIAVAVIAVAAIVVVVAVITVASVAFAVIAALTNLTTFILFGQLLFNLTTILLYTVQTKNNDASHCTELRLKAQALQKHHHHQKMSEQNHLRFPVGAIVTPGDRLGSLRVLSPGEGTYARGGKVFASSVGTLQRKGDSDGGPSEVSVI